MIGSDNTRFVLPASERLKLRKNIETLFHIGEAFSIYPLRIVYTFQPISEVKEESSAGMQMGISVPKKRFKRAHDRNRIKRLVREAWRLQKHLLVPSLSKEHQLHIFFIFVGKEMLTYDLAYKNIGNAIEKLSHLVPPPTQA